MRRDSWHVPPMLRDPTRRRLLGLAAMAGMALALRPAPLRAATETDALRRALAAAARGRWPDALSEGAAAGPLGHDVIRWLWLRDDGGNLGDYEDFIARRPDWPGMPWLRMKGEAAVARSQTPARIVASPVGYSGPGASTSSPASHRQSLVANDPFSAPLTTTIWRASTASAWMRRATGWPVVVRRLRLPAPNR